MLADPIKALLLSEVELDAGLGDETSNLVLDPRNCEARAIAKTPGVFFGAEILQAFSDLYSGKITEHPIDGTRFEKGDTLFQLAGPLHETLLWERTLLNLLSHLCGVASLTHQYVEAVSGTRARILATRKTLPGLRALQLRAVQAGGGSIHRRALSDGILIKDNHLVHSSAKDAIERARRGASPLHKVEIEVDNFALLSEALEARPDVILLDNFSLEELASAVKLVDRRCAIEVSGGITLENVKAVAELGVDFISVGRMTHSAPSTDISLELKCGP